MIHSLDMKGFIFMRKVIALLLMAAMSLALITGCMTASADNTVTWDIAKDGTALYSICRSSKVFNGDLLGPSDVLAYYLKMISGVEFPGIKAESALENYEIFIGTSEAKAKAEHINRVAQGGYYRLDSDLVGDSGYAVRFFEGTDANGAQVRRISLLGASIDATYESFWYFLTKYLGITIPYEETETKASTLSVDIDRGYIFSEYLSIDGIVDLTIAGNKLTDYSIVYDEGTEDALLNLRRNLFAVGGEDLAVVKPGEAAATAKTISIKLGGVADGEYSVTVQDGNIVIAGSDIAAVKYAVNRFCEDALFCKNGYYVGEAVVDIPASLNLAGKAGYMFDSYKADGVFSSDYIRHNISDYLGISYTDTVCFSDSSVADKLYDAIMNSKPAPRKGDEVLLVNNTANYCTCDKCKGGTEAFFNTVNAVAEKFAADGITIGVTAYKETRKPTVEKMNDNVKVYVIEPEVDCAKAINDESCAFNKAFADDLKAWVAAASNVTVLDMTMAYYDYPSTFPNFGIIYPNIAFYAEIGIDNVYMTWESNAALLEFAWLRMPLIKAMLQNPTMSKEDYDTLYRTVLEDLYGKNADKIQSYIDKFTSAAAKSFTILSNPDEILPIARNDKERGAAKYDLTLAKELGQIWEDVYDRHAAPEKGFDRLFDYQYKHADYYAQLHSRVQYTYWIDGNVDKFDRTDVFNEIINSFSK